MIVIMLTVSMGCINVDGFAAHAEPLKKVAIIIDDLGNGMKGTQEIMNLPAKVNVAIMPFLPTTKKMLSLRTKKGLMCSFICRWSRIEAGGNGSTRSDYFRSVR